VSWSYLFLLWEAGILRPVGNKSPSQKGINVSMI
jgi:hypothetical protein